MTQCENWKRAFIYTYTYTRTNLIYPVDESKLPNMISLKILLFSSFISTCFQLDYHDPSSRSVIATPQSCEDNSDMMQKLVALVNECYNESKPFDSPLRKAFRFSYYDMDPFVILDSVVTEEDSFNLLLLMNCVRQISPHNFEERYFYPSFVNNALKCILKAF